LNVAGFHLFVLWHAEQFACEERCIVSFGRSLLWHEMHALPFAPLTLLWLKVAGFHFLVVWHSEQPAVNLRCRSSFGLSLLWHEMHWPAVPLPALP